MRVRRAHEGDRAGGIGCFACDFEVGRSFQDMAQSFAYERVVVGDENTDHGCVSSGCNAFRANVMERLNPLPGAAVTA